jgi:hypothetical protein
MAQLAIYSTSRLVDRLDTGAYQYISIDRRRDT